MLFLALGFAPVIAFGAFAGWLHTSRTAAPTIVNLIAEAPASKRRDRGRSVVDAVVLHQTGFSRGLDHLRYRNVTAHFVILRDGTVLQLHPTSARLPASDGFNSRSVAIEFVGNFPSSKGGWWKPEKYGRHHPTAEQLEAGRRLLRMLRRAGISHVFAHRQSSHKRSNDPGPEVWAAVGQWAIDSLGMSDGGEDFLVGSGSPIPPAWRTAGLKA